MCNHSYHGQMAVRRAERELYRRGSRRFPVLPTRQADYVVAATEAIAATAARRHALRNALGELRAQQGTPVPVPVLRAAMTVALPISRGVRSRLLAAAASEPVPWSTLVERLDTLHAHGHAANDEFNRLVRRVVCALPRSAPWRAALGLFARYAPDMDEEQALSHGLACAAAVDCPRGVAKRFIASRVTSEASARPVARYFLRVGAGWESALRSAVYVASRAASEAASASSTPSDHHPSYHQPIAATMNVTAALAALSEAAKSPATVSSTELRLIVDEMCRGAPSLTANRSLWHSYIRGCCRRGEWRHALRVATENMRAWGLAPDAVTVGIVMTDGLVVRDPAAANSKRTDVVVLQRCVSDVALRLAAQFAGDRAIATNERVVACVELAGRVARADLEGDPVSGKVRILLTR